MYQTLYRKYRPKVIDDVVGQDIAVRIIKNSLKNNQINHAYLFSGPRGTGKTTMAKILSKSVNCLNLQDGNTCEACKNCKTINNGETVDIIEIDAASNNGVDEIREIRNSVSLSCSLLKYKIYIIDEVHMLTIGAFNALLKTLEEPPEHIIFILATTDPQKVPATILSRCQCINFETISDIDIKKRLKTIADKENATIDDNVFDKLAEISNGGMRDAIGNLEKLIVASVNPTITINDFNAIFGFVDDILLSEFFNEILNKDIINLLNKTNDLYESGKNLILFTNELIDFTRKKIEEYYKDHNDVCPYFSLVFYLNDLCNQMKNTDNVRTIFQAGIIQVVNKLENISNTNEQHNEIEKEKQQVISEVKVETTNTNLEEKKEKKLTETINADDEEKNIQRENNEIIMNNAFALANKNDLINLKENIKKLNDYLLDKDIGAAACYLIDGNIRVCGDCYIIISYEYNSMVTRGFEMYDKLTNILEKILNKKCYICFLTDEEWDREKKKYIENIHQHKKYGVKELLDKSSVNLEQVNDDNEVDIATSLFGKDIIEVK